MQHIFIKSKYTKGSNSPVKDSPMFCTLPPSVGKQSGKGDGARTNTSITIIQDDTELQMFLK